MTVAPFTHQEMESLPCKVNCHANEHGLMGQSEAARTANGGGIIHPGANLNLRRGIGEQNDYERISHDV